MAERRYGIREIVIYALAARSPLLELIIRHSLAYVFSFLLRFSFSWINRSIGKVVREQARMELLQLVIGRATGHDICARRLRIIITIFKIYDPLIHVYTGTVDYCESEPKAFTTVE